MTNLGKLVEGEVDEFKFEQGSEKFLIKLFFSILSVINFEDE